MFSGFSDFLWAGFMVAGGVLWIALAPGLARTGPNWLLGGRQSMILMRFMGGVWILLGFLLCFLTLRPPWLYPVLKFLFG